MADESPLSTRVTTRRDVPTAGDRMQPPSDQGAQEKSSICDGCRELTVRIERLEQQLLRQSSDGIASTGFNTTTCYWICVAFHVFLTICLFSSPLLITVGAVFLLGAFGSAVVCHVFATRTIPQKFLRTLLSCSIVITTAVFLLSMQDMFDFSDAVPMILVFMPFLFASGWLMAKIFVWTRGWKLVPPGVAREPAALQIRHLLFCTLVVAMHLTAIRFFVSDFEDWTMTDTAGSIVSMAVPLAVATIYCCVLARIMLSHRRRRLARNLGLVALSIIGLVFVAYVAVGAVTDVQLFELEAALATLVYTVMALVGISISPVFTFLMLRTVGYRLYHA